MPSQHVGAWEVADNSYEGLFIFTESHYCHAIMEKNRQPFGDEGNPSDAEAASAFKSMFAGSGTYSVEGSNLTINEEMNRVPNGIGRKTTYSMSMDGETMTLKSSRSGVEVTLRKAS